MGPKPITVNELMIRLQQEVERDPRVGTYTILWSNAAHRAFEVRHEGRWVMLGVMGKGKAQSHGV
jgi:hypothetical protein